MEFTGINTTAPNGGIEYGQRNYVLRVKKQYCYSGKEPTDTEAILVKNGFITDLKDDIQIYTQDGKVHTSIESYLTDHAISPFSQSLGFWMPWGFVDVLAKNTYYGSNWVDGGNFATKTAPSDVGLCGMPTPAPYTPPSGGVAYGLATYLIRHTKNTAPAQPSTKRTATLTIRNIDDHFIKDSLEQHYFTLAHWHLMNPLATEEDIEKDLKISGSPWSYIDVKVGDEWVTGINFLAQRRSADAGSECRPPRQNAEAPSMETEALSKPVDRAMTDYVGMDEPYGIRLSAPHRNAVLNAVIRRAGGFENALTKKTYYEYQIELEENLSADGESLKTLWTMGEFVNEVHPIESDIPDAEAWHYVDIQVDGIWHKAVDVSEELFNIRIERDEYGEYEEIFGPAIPQRLKSLLDFDGGIFEDAITKMTNSEQGMTPEEMTIIMEEFGPGIPEGYEFDPVEFYQAYQKYYQEPESYWEEFTFAELMDNYGPQPVTRPSLDDLEEMDYQTSLYPKL